MDINISFPNKCRRCKKPILDGEKATGVMQYWKNRIIRLEGSTVMRTWAYHDRCIPPVLFHKQVAAANPALHASGPSEMSTQKAGPGD